MGYAFYRLRKGTQVYYAQLLTLIFMQIQMELENRDFRVAFFPMFVRRWYIKTTYEVESLSSRLALRGFTVPRLFNLKNVRVS